MKTNYFPLACLMITLNINDHTSVQCADMLSALAKTGKDSFLQSTDQQCPKFKCQTDDRLDGMDLCYKPDHLQENLGIVHLKECKDGKMCHGKLNRCMFDPYNMFEGKLPG